MFLFVGVHALQLQWFFGFFVRWAGGGVALRRDRWPDLPSFPAVGAPPTKQNSKGPSRPGVLPTWGVLAAVLTLGPPLHGLLGRCALPGERCLEYLQVYIIGFEKCQVENIMNF